MISLLKERNRGTANLVAFLACVGDRRVAILACAISGQRKERMRKKKGKKTADEWGQCRSGDEGRDSACGLVGFTMKPFKGSSNKLGSLDSLGKQI